MLRFLIILAVFSPIHGVHYCGDRPNTCCDVSGVSLGYSWRHINFAGIFMGHSGAMKSTTIDLLTGGYFMTATSYQSKSETEASNCYVFDYLGNQDPNFQHEQWLMIDTPGTADSSASPQVEKRNSVQMGQLINSVGNLDAIFVAWDYRTVRSSPEVLNSIAAARATVGPAMWKRMVMVYTFIDFDKDGAPGFSGSCGSPIQRLLHHMGSEQHCARQKCVAMSNISDYHHTRMNDLWGHINGSFGAPDAKCQGARDESDCFPDAGHIPFIGIGTDELDSSNTFVENGIFSVDPSDISDCPLSMEEQLKTRLPGIAHSMRAANTRFDTSSIINGYAAFLSAQEQIGQIPSESVHSAFESWADGAEPGELVANLAIVFDTGILKYRRKLQKTLLGKALAQEVLGFELYQIRGSRYLGGQQPGGGVYGFDRLDLNTVTTWPSYRMKQQCQTATEHTSPSSGLCRTQLRTYYASLPPNHDPNGNDEYQRRQISQLQSALRCFCQVANSRENARFSCTLVGVSEASPYISCNEEGSNLKYCSDQGAASNTLNSLPQDASEVPEDITKKICILAPHCTSGVCDNYHYPKNLFGNIQCQANSCTDDECCNVRADCTQLASTQSCANGLNWNSIFNHEEQSSSNTLCRTDSASCDKATCCFCQQGTSQCWENWDHCDATWDCSYVGAGCACESDVAELSLAAEPPARCRCNNHGNISTWHCDQHYGHGQCNPYQFCQEQRQPFSVPAAGPGYVLCQVADTCDHWSCSGVKYYNISDADSRRCRTSPCGEEDNSVCCSERAHCPSYNSLCAWYQVSDTTARCPTTLETCDRQCCGVGLFYPVLVIVLILLVIGCYLNKYGLPSCMGHDEAKSGFEETLLKDPESCTAQAESQTGPKDEPIDTMQANTESLIKPPIESVTTAGAELEDPNAPAAGADADDPNAVLVADSVEVEQQANIAESLIAPPI